MDQLNQLVSAIALTMGVSWASGINLYAAILTLGWLGTSGNLDLPPGLELVQDPIVLTAAAVMFCVEFFADKIPGVDTGWDSIQTFVRIPAGAVLAASAVGEVNPALTVAAALIGGGVAAATHATKAGGRVLINTSPEPFSNWTASFVEDIAVIAGLWAAVTHPWVFLGLFALFIVLVVWLLPKIWRGIVKLFRGLAGLFGRSQPEALDKTAPDMQLPQHAEK